MQEGSSVPSVGANDALEGPSDLSRATATLQGFWSSALLAADLAARPIFFRLDVCDIASSEEVENMGTNTAGRDSGHYGVQSRVLPYVLGRMDGADQHEQQVP